MWNCQSAGKSGHVVSMLEFYPGNPSSTPARCGTTTEKIPKTDKNRPPKKVFPS